MLILATVSATAWVLGTADPPSPEPGIAVMPFQTLGASQPSAFTQGVYWDVLTDLAAAEGLEVISPTSVEQLRNPDGPLPRITDRLGVGWVVRGEVQETVGRVQVNVRLMDPCRDRQVWAGRYSRGLSESDPLALQREMTREIAARRRSSARSWTPCRSPRAPGNASSWASSPPEAWKPTGSPRRAVCAWASAAGKRWSRREPTYDSALLLEAMILHETGRFEEALDAWPTVTSRYLFGRVWDGLRDDPRHVALVRRRERSWGLLCSHTS